MMFAINSLMLYRMRIAVKLASAVDLELHNGTEKAGEFQLDNSCCTCIFRGVHKLAGFCVIELVILFAESVLM